MHLRARLALVLGWLATLSPLAPLHAAPATVAPTLIVLDASGSMRGRIKGETKMQIAKRAVDELIATLPAHAEVGLIAYGHRKGSDCNDIEPLIPPFRLERDRFSAAIATIEARGMTPLSGAMESAANTGGRFLQANDAASLRDALAVAIVETVKALDAPPPLPEELGPATLLGPDEVVVGAAFEVTWTGPNNPGDTITIVPNAAADSAYGPIAYTRQGSPVGLASLADPGAAELRCITGRSRTMLARVRIDVTAP